jgi:hypothetical protein
MATVLAEVVANQSTQPPRGFYADENAILGWLQVGEEYASLPEELPQATEQFLRSIYRRRADREQDTASLLQRAAADIDSMEDLHVQTDVRLMVAGLGGTAIEQVAPNVQESVKVFREVVRRSVGGASLRLVKTTDEAPGVSELSVELATTAPNPELKVAPALKAVSAASSTEGRPATNEKTEPAANSEQFEAPQEQTQLRTGVHAELADSKTHPKHHKNDGAMCAEDIAEILGLTPKQVRRAIEKAASSDEEIGRAVRTSVTRTRLGGQQSRHYRAASLDKILGLFSD